MPPEVAPVPKVGDRAPWSDELAFPSPKPVIVVFLRQVGSPFAEKTFNALTKLSVKHPEIQFVAVSHSSRAATDRWVVQVGGEWEVEVVVDEARALYSAWGLGEGSTWYNVNPWSLYSAFRLGKDEGIWGTGGDEGDATGSRWQIGGAFAVDASGFIRWVKVESSPDDMPDLKEAIKALEPAKTGLA